MKIIGFAGKGGTGKTTLAALFLKSLLENGKKEILVIDSDPNECLASVLGVKEYVRLSDVVKKYRGKTMNPEQFSEDFATMLTMNEQDGFDILVMGRGESEGCYCVINHLLKSSFERNILAGSYAYEYVLVDCEAGIEHISRKTSTSIDELVIVTDASRMGLETIRRIKDVSAEVESEVKKFYVVGNKVQSEEVGAEIQKAANKLGAKYLGSIPYDALVEEFNFRQKKLLEIPKESKAYKEVKKMFSKKV